MRIQLIINSVDRDTWSAVSPRPVSGVLQISFTYRTFPEIRNRVRVSEKLTNLTIFHGFPVKN